MLTIVAGCCLSQQVAEDQAKQATQQKARAEREVTEQLAQVSLHVCTQLRS